MSALAAIPARERLEAVLMLGDGRTWAVGIGCLVAGQIERERVEHLCELDAIDVALHLSDEFDLIVVRSEARDA